jgi:hypothetical protein
MSAASWSFYLGLMTFLTVVFGVFYLVAYSALAGVVENYRRYYQKADLQWTGPGRRKNSRWALLLPIILGLALLSSWLVVHFIIFG